MNKHYYCIRQAIGLDILSITVYARLLDWIHWAPLCTPGYWTGYIEHYCVRQAIELGILYTIHGLDYWTRLWNRAWWIMNGELWIVILLDNKRWINITTVYARLCGLDILSITVYARLCGLDTLSTAVYARLRELDILSITVYARLCELDTLSTAVYARLCELDVLYTIHDLGYVN